jgi:Sulfatase
MLFTTVTNFSTGKARFIASIAVLALLHVAAIAVLLTTEDDLTSKAAFVLTWILLNSLWFIVLRRPAAAAGMSLVMIVLLIALSLFKHRALTMTISVFDVMVVDADTISFVLSTFPDLQRQLTRFALVAVPVLILIWWIDPIRVRVRAAFASFILSFVALAALSFAVPLDREDEFQDHNYVSKFARSGAVAAVDLATQPILEADANTVDELAPGTEGGCRPAAKFPHIIMVLDESSFDVRTMPGIKVLPDYKRHFHSLDGKERRLVVEGAGGPTWFTEYNVLTGLSVRSYGRFADGVTRIAAGRVQRGLPWALQHCGYRTFSFYPYTGAFLGARSFQTTAGIEHFQDAKHLGSIARNPDSFYYDHAARTLTWEIAKGPVFFLVYTVANHFPWDRRFRPDLTPDWRNLGNKAELDEYLRRQDMSARDYSQFVDRLKRDFPDESFLIVRFGDHQPGLAKYFIDPTLAPSEVAQRIKQLDPRYYTSYYAIDAINFSPVDLSSALDTLDAPYLPLVVLEAAGVPLDPSFAEQKKILQRCGGKFYLCNSGAEARRFNRLLIEAGLISGL